MGDGHPAVTQEGLQVGDAPSTDRASHMIPDAKLLPHVLGLLGLRHNPRHPILNQTSPTLWDYWDVLGLMGQHRYIAIGDELLQLIVFNFTEYLTSTLCTNLQLGYLALDLLSPSIYLSAPLVLRL